MKRRTFLKTAVTGQWVDKTPLEITSPADMTVTQFKRAFHRLALPNRRSERREEEK
jgi:hypothetical protein